jgi:hypothetical protein
MTKHFNCEPAILRRVVGLLMLLGSSQFRLHGVEKHWIAHEAQVIIVGTFTPNPTYPWLDGWHLTGTINVEEVLYGPQMPHQIGFRLVCEWDAPWWPPPRYPSAALVRGLWFLKRIDENTWESALRSDQGCRFLSERGYWEEYIRQHKVSPWPGFHKKTSIY